MSFNLVEIIGTTKVYDNKVSLIRKVRDRFNMKDGDKLVWGINKDGQLILTKAEIERYY